MCFVRGKKISMNRIENIRVLAFGEILWDIIDGVGHLGGAPFNFAAHFAQYGARSSIISAVGKDKYGKDALRIAKDYGVDTSFVQVNEEHATGTVDVTLKDGIPSYIIKTGVAYDFIRYDWLQKNFSADKFDIFYFGSLAQRNAVSAATLKQLLIHHHFPYVFYDVNLRMNGYSRSIVLESLQRCNVLKLNVEEVGVLAELLFGDGYFTVQDFCDRVARVYSISITIVTAAENGCFVYDEGVLSRIPGKSIVMSDAVGAGDAFSASFMFEFLKHGDVLKSATRANEVGAFVASQKGAIPRYPSDMLQSFAGK